jgi:protein dithiol:quinone oxidoreductase
MMYTLLTLARSKLWWVLLLVLGMSMIGIALYYQYMLSEWPCVLCIHVRILFLLLIIIAGFALLVSRIKKILPLMHVLVAVTSAALLNRAWTLLATERGWVEGVCDVNVGMPAWLALDKWLPDIFSAWTACGYTPVIAFGVTMAEILLVLSVLLLASSVVMTGLVLRKSQ